MIREPDGWERWMLCDPVKVICFGQTVQEPCRSTYPNNTVLKNSLMTFETIPPSDWKNDLTRYAVNLSVVGKN